MTEVITLPEAVKQLLAIVERLQEAYKDKGKKFSLDGRLVGDIGEVLVESEYDITLFPGLQKYHDATCNVLGRKVQIKSTMKKHLTFPADHVPDYFIGIRIKEDGTFDEVFNGPGAIASEAIKNRGHSKTNLHSVSISALKKLNEQVGVEERIPRRRKTPAAALI